MRSGRPTPPEKSVSPVRTNQGSAARVLSVTRIETLSGVCPGVWRIESMTLPRSCCSRSEEHTSELQSHLNLVCRLLLEKKKKKIETPTQHNYQRDSIDARYLSR